MGYLESPMNLSWSLDCGSETGKTRRKPTQAQGELANSTQKVGEPSQNPELTRYEATVQTAGRHP